MVQPRRGNLNVALIGRDFGTWQLTIGLGIPCEAVEMNIQHGGPTRADPLRKILFSEDRLIAQNGTNSSNSSRARQAPCQGHLVLQRMENIKELSSLKNGRRFLNYFRTKIQAVRC